MNMVFNNRGFGLKQMILFCAMLLVALFFAIFFTNQLMSEFKESFKEGLKEDISYDSIERKIESGAGYYMKNYYKDEVGTGTITILSDNLIKHDLLKNEDLVTSDEDNCKGYALVRKNTDGKLEITPYINCNNYVTKDYQSWRVGEY